VLSLSVQKFCGATLFAGALYATVHASVHPSITSRSST